MDGIQKRKAPEEKAGIFAIGLNDEGQWMVLAPSSIGRFFKDNFVPTVTKGSIDPGESPLIAAKREFKEESGIDLDSFEGLSAGEMVQDHYLGTSGELMPLSISAVVIPNIEQFSSRHLKGDEYAAHESTSPTHFAHQLGVPSGLDMLKRFQSSLELVKPEQQTELYRNFYHDLQGLISNIEHENDHDVTHVMNEFDQFLENHARMRNQPFLKTALKSLENDLCNHCPSVAQGEIKLDKQVRPLHYMIERIEYKTLHDYLESIEHMIKMPNKDDIMTRYLVSLTGTGEGERRIPGQIHIVLRAIAEVAPQALAALDPKHQHFVEEAGIELAHAETTRLDR